MQPPELKEGERLCPRCGGRGFLDSLMQRACERCKGGGAVAQARQRSGNTRPCTR